MENLVTDGPHSDWLGMPDDYIHTLTVEGEDYKYLAGDAKLDVSIGDLVCFRYQEASNKEKRIDKRSLVIAIDPATLNL